MHVLAVGASTYKKQEHTRSGCSSTHAQVVGVRTSESGPWGSRSRLPRAHAQVGVSDLQQPGPTPVQGVHRGSEFGVQGAGCRVKGAGCRVQGVG